MCITRLAARTGSTDVVPAMAREEFAFRSRRTTGNKISRQTKFHANIDSGRVIADAKGSEGGSMRGRDRGREKGRESESEIAQSPRKSQDRFSAPSESDCRLSRVLVLYLQCKIAVKNDLFVRMADSKSRRFLVKSRTTRAVCRASPMGGIKLFGK